MNWTSTRKTKRKPSGGSIATAFRLESVFIACFCAWLALGRPAFGVSGAQDKKQAQESYALIAGTVFQKSGLSLAGAEITVTPLPPEESSGKPRKIKKVRAASDSRGEFAMRVPAVPMRYTVSVEAAGFQSQDKEITIQGEDHVDLYFRLDPAAK